MDTVHSLCIFLTRVNGTVIDSRRISCRHADAWESDCCLAKIKIHGFYYFAQFIFPDFSLTFPDKMKDFP